MLYAQEPQYVTYTLSSAIRLRNYIVDLPDGVKKQTERDGGEAKMRKVGSARREEAWEQGMAAPGKNTNKKHRLLCGNSRRCVPTPRYGSCSSYNTARERLLSTRSLSKCRVQQHRSTIQANCVDPSIKLKYHKNSEGVPVDVSWLATKPHAVAADFEYSGTWC